MPRTISRLRAFVASPSDTLDERERLKQVVSELNRTWADSLSLEIELVRWETHAYPGFKTDPQEVINEQIGDDYEIFIGLIWSKFGTPTPRALSGTQEEFERAYKRFQANPNSVSLLFYFKEQAIPPSKINPVEIDHIQKFRAGLGDLGGLYWTFETLADFEALVRPHLAKVIQVWRTRIEAQSTTSPPAMDIALNEIPNRSASEADDSEIDELGYLDYMEIGEDASSVMTAALERMTSAMADLSTNMQKRTIATTDIISSPTLSSAKAVANDTAGDLQSFTKTVSAEIPVFGEAYGDLLRAFSGAASIAVEARNGHEQILKTLAQIEQLRAALEDSKGLLSTFSESLRSTPRMTTELNRARRKTLKVLGVLDTEFEKAVSNSIMVEKSIRNLLAGEE